MNGRMIVGIVGLVSGIFFTGFGAGATIQHMLDKKSYDGLLDQLGYHVYHIGNTVTAVRKVFYRNGSGS